MFDNHPDAFGTPMATIQGERIVWMEPSNDGNSDGGFAVATGTAEFVLCEGFVPRTFPEHKVELDITIDRQMLHDIMVTAFDGDHGGSLFWINNDSVKLESSGPIEDARIWDAVVFNEWSDDGWSDKEHRVDHFVLVKGIQALVNQGWQPIINAVLDGDAGEIDANLADSIVQEGLFGKQVYG